jgi:hypothetical protein
MQVAQGTQNNIRAWCHAAVPVPVSSVGNPCRVIREITAADTFNEYEGEYDV